MAALRRFRAELIGEPVGATAITGIGRPGLGLGGPIDYGYTWPFANLMHYGRAWNSYSQDETFQHADAYGWLFDVPPGTTNISSLLALLEADSSHYIKPGQYVLKWSGPMSATVTGGLVSNVVAVNANRVTFSVTDGLGDITVRCSNNSSSPASLIDMVVCHAEHESVLDAGDPFNPEYIANSISENTKTVRTMDWQATNSSEVIGIETVRTEAHRSWTASKGCPASICAKFAQKLGVDLYFHVPHKATDAAMDAMFAQVAANFTNPALKCRAAFTNEYWNTMFPHGSWLAANAPAGIVVRDGGGAVMAGTESTYQYAKSACAYADGALRAWRAAEAALGRARVVRILEGFVVVPAAQDTAALEYVDPGHIQSGAAVKDLVDMWAGAPYVHPTLSGQIQYQKTLIITNAAGQSDAYWQTLIHNGIAQSSAWQANAKAVVQAKVPGLPITTYEFNHHLYYMVGSALSNFSVRIDQSDNTLVIESGSEAAFGDGDVIVPFPFYQPGHADHQKFFSTSVGYWVPLYVRKVGIAKMRVYKSQAAYVADSENTGAGSLALDQPPGNDYHCDNYTRVHALGERWKQLWGGSTYGPAWLKKMHEDIFQANGIVDMMYFVNESPWSNGQAVSAWGLRKNSGPAGGTPIWDAFRSLAVSDGDTSTAGIEITSGLQVIAGTAAGTVDIAAAMGIALAEMGGGLTGSVTVGGEVGGDLAGLGGSLSGSLGEPPNITFTALSAVRIGRTPARMAAKRIGRKRP